MRPSRRGTDRRATGRQRRQAIPPRMPIHVRPACQEGGEDEPDPATEQIDHRAVTERGGIPLLRDPLAEVREGVAGGGAGEEAEADGQKQGSVLQGLRRGNGGQFSCADLLDDPILRALNLLDRESGCRRAVERKEISGRSGAPPCAPATGEPRSVSRWSPSRCRLNSNSDPFRHDQSSRTVRSRSRSRSGSARMSIATIFPSLTVKAPTATGSPSRVETPPGTPLMSAGWATRPSGV